MRRLIPAAAIAAFLVVLAHHAYVVAQAVAAWATIAAGGRNSADGAEAITVDLPDSQHQRNITSRGRGCCVFKSITHAADYQHVPALLGFAEWMRDKGIAGGGYPEKVDDLIPRICSDRGAPVPEYVQHTGGDLEFLRLALKTGRYPAVTYSGRDGVYYHNSIAHMVNLVHLSERWAVIHDNNRPGQYLWMTPAEFAARWRGMGGGWAVVLLSSPPPPVPINASMK